MLISFTISYHIPSSILNPWFTIIGVLTHLHQVGMFWLQGQTHYFLVLISEPQSLGRIFSDPKLSYQIIGKDSFL